MPRRIVDFSDQDFHIPDHSVLSGYVNPGMPDEDDEDDEDFETPKLIPGQIRIIDFSDQGLL